MVLQYYVVENTTGKQIEIDIESATNEDLTSTKEKWQSDWTSEFIRDPKLEKYAAKTDAGEIVALGAYREDDHGISVFIANIEAHPESNPTISTVRKYAGIGRMMIAYGIQLSIDSGHGGIVTFEAKTDELYDHYIKDFHAVPIFQPHSGGPKLLMLADEARTRNFQYLLILKIGGFSMKDQELELQVAPMSNDTMEYLNVLFGVCKRFKTDYYHATPKQREFIDAVATHEYQLMKAHEKGLSRGSVPPFMGMKRSERSNNMPA